MSASSLMRRHRLGLLLATTLTAVLLLSGCSAKKELQSATHKLDTLAFVVPRPNGQNETWHLSIPDPSATGAAQFEIGTSAVWDLEQVDSISTG